MQKYLLKLDYSADLDGAFTPEQLAMMQRVFDTVCQESQFDDPELQRETLALVILRATKAKAREQDLFSLARHAAKNYRDTK
jgi:hypothetical protein